MRYVQLLTAIGFIAFWVTFFTLGFSDERYPECYEAFELSFPLPDSFIALVLIGAWYWHVKKPDTALRLTRVAGSAMIFLGLCDFSFNYLQGIYAISTSELIGNAVINVWSLGFGAYQAFFYKVAKQPS